VSKDGNLLLKVGPTARGNFDPRAVESLRGVGEWMKLHSRSIYGAGPAEWTPPADARYTYGNNRLYLHLFSWPFEYVHLPGLAGKVEYAQSLNDASEVAMLELGSDRQAIGTTQGSQPAGTLTLKLPVQRPEVAVPVVELFLKTGV
jgi:alpha-L-fucosidase